MQQTQPAAASGGGNGAIVAVLVVAVIALAAFFAYQQGFLGGKSEESPGPTKIDINLPGGSPAPAY